MSVEYWPAAKGSCALVHKRTQMITSSGRWIYLNLSQECLFHRVGFQSLTFMDGRQCSYDHLPCPGNSKLGPEGADGVW